MPFDLACPDWADRLERGETPIADLPLDQTAAELAVDVFNMLCLPDGRDNPFEDLEPVQGPKHRPLRIIKR